MSPVPMFKFRLFVADHSPNAGQALGNLTAMCRQYLCDRYEIEVVDVLREPQRALADGVTMTPTLVKLAPEPVERVVGALGDPKAVLVALGLDALAR